MNFNVKRFNLMVFLILLFFLGGTGFVIAQPPLDRDDTPEIISITTPPDTGLVSNTTTYTGTVFPAAVSVTGQMISYAEGDDGWWQYGISGPFPRYTINGNGTATDNRTGLTFVQDMMCTEGLDFDTALVAIENLTEGMCGLTSAGMMSGMGYRAGYFEMGNIAEATSLFNFGYANPALSNQTGYGQAVDGGNLFGNIAMCGRTSTRGGTVWQGHHYNRFSVGYSGIELTGACTDTNPIIDRGPPIFPRRLQMVAPHSVTSGGNTYVAGIPKTGQTVTFATGDDGNTQRGVAWPNPRFTDNGDGTVLDNLTGLIWLKDADCFGEQSWNESLTDANMLADGACGLSDGSQAGDWRMSNVLELNSLIHHNHRNPALPNTVGDGQWSAGDPFMNVQSNGEFYWASTTFAADTTQAWFLHLLDGIRSSTPKINNLHLWPVKGGVRVEKQSIYLPLMMK